MRAAGLLAALVTVPLLISCVPTAHKPNQRVDVFIHADGSFDVGDKHAKGYRALEAQLHSLERADRDMTLSMRPDDDVPYDKVASLMSRLSDSGFTRIGFVGTEEYVQ